MKVVPVISRNESDSGDRDLIPIPGCSPPTDSFELHADFTLGGKTHFFHIHFPANGFNMVIDYSIFNFPGNCFFAIHESSNCNDLGDRYYNAKTVSEDPWPSATIKKGSMITSLGEGSPITIPGGNGFTRDENQNHAAAIYKKVTTTNGRIKEKLLDCNYLYIIA